MISISSFVFFATLVSSSLALGLPGFGGGSGEKRNVFVTMKHGTDPIIDKINSQNFPNRAAKLEALTSGLQGLASLSQGPVLKLLNSMQSFGNRMEFKSMWITNQVYVKGINSALVNTLSSTFPNEIASIEDEEIFSLFPDDEEDVKEVSVKQFELPTWGVQKIQAPEVWNTGNKGAGIIVGSIDTGVRGTHFALRNNYVGSSNYGWYDPSGRTSSPNDGNGHGTHTVGTICGANGIGVAPEAKWMACKGCAGSSCSGSDLAACGEFMLCPTDTRGQNRNCAKAPHIVSNSWGGGGGSTWYERILRAWRAAGIIPVFSAGNSGSQCRTMGSPGDSQYVIGVGSTTRYDQLSRFSSKGPARSGLRKPDVSAPGSDIWSSWRSGDASYRSISGTSMACPHVAGVVALMLSGASRDVGYDEVKQKLERGCTTANLSTPSRFCQPATRPYRFPNNEYGHGLVNALNSVNLVK